MRVILACFCIIWWLAIATYWMLMGVPVHLLWLCDLGLLLTGIGFLLRSSVLLTSQFIGGFLVQLIWSLDFLPRLLFGMKIFGWTGYMFSPTHSAIAKFLSLFHLFLPVLLLYGVIKYGYAKTGLRLQVIITVPLYILSYLLTNSADNTNWVLGPFWKAQGALPPLIYLALWMILTFLMYGIFDFVSRRFYFKNDH